MELRSLLKDLSYFTKSNKFGGANIDALKTREIQNMKGKNIKTGITGGLASAAGGSGLEGMLEVSQMKKYLIKEEIEPLLERITKLEKINEIKDNKEIEKSIKLNEKNEIKENKEIEKSIKLNEKNEIKENKEIENKEIENKEIENKEIKKGNLFGNEITSIISGIYYGTTGLVTTPGCYIKLKNAKTFLLKLMMDIDKRISAIEKVNSNINSDIYKKTYKLDKLGKAGNFLRGGLGGVCRDNILKIKRIILDTIKEFNDRIDILEKK